MEIKRNIANYIGENCNRFFKIPAYQRGYKWGMEKPLQKDGKEIKESDASILLDDIITAMENGKSEYFIQGITVYENGSDVVLIDGQQRTTTLFLLLNLLMSETEKQKYLFFDGAFKLKYNIRTSSHEYLESICGGKEFISDTNTQDIHFFESAQAQMKQKFEGNDLEKLKKYILSKVMLFYIRVPEAKASKVFSMLNGVKAFMKTDELIKAEFLIKASGKKASYTKDITENITQTLEILKKQIGDDWTTNALRSQFARQWDKWLYWWNRKDVQVFFRSGSNPMGLLLEYFYKKNKDSGEYSNKADDVSSVFKSFQNLLIKDVVTAKNNFEKLRKLQKQFEDLYNRPHFHNHLGVALSCSKIENKLVIRYFLDHFKDVEAVRRFTLLSLIDTTYNEIINNDIDSVKEKFANQFGLLSRKMVYTDAGAKEIAFRQLFWLNVDADNQRGQKFEFFFEYKNQLKSYYENRSLEHIWPKSRVLIKKEDKEEYFCVDEKDNVIEPPSDKSGLLLREKFDEQNVSEHCIGNLLFLHIKDNSVFSNKLPEDKKKVYFNLERLLYSRNLLHTMSVFAYDNWGQENTINNIHQNQEKVLSQIKKQYEQYVN
ncbi:MAG: DUF262 domain-containing protein [Paludibacter sp.]|nr:DUF262 domain-containing protein [Paludibacter sp.]